jgi:alkylated DNA repair dioxygenase AlkB
MDGFQVPTKPKDLKVKNNVLSTQELKSIKDWIDRPNASWCNVSAKVEGRRTQHFGSLALFEKVDYSIAMSTTTEQKLGYKNKPACAPIPAELSAFVKRLKELNILNFDPDLIHIYSYESHDSLHQHFDDFDSWEEEIVMMSISGTTTLRFTMSGHDDTDPFSFVYDLFTKPGTIVVLRGDARYQWKHGIPRGSWDWDPESERFIYRERRISMVLRRKKVSGANLVKEAKSSLVETTSPMNLEAKSVPPKVLYPSAMIAGACVGVALCFGIYSWMKKK